MALEKILKNSSGVPTGEYERIAGGTLYADNPIGAIVPFGGTDIPAGFLLCNGAEVLKTDYAELYAVIGDAFGTASVNTKFVLPDLREATTKGAGLTGKSNVHYDSDGVALGEFVEDRVSQHTHDFPQSSNMSYQVGTGNYKNVPVSGGSTESDGVHTGYRFGATTEVKSVGVNYIIKAKMIAVPADFMSAVEDAVEEALGSDWNTITDVSAPTYFASVNLKYKKIGNILFVHGKATFNAVTIPSDSYDVLIATLPSGYRPKSAIRSVTNIENGFSIISPQVQIEFSTNGKLMVYASENIALGASGKPISFQFVVES